MNILLLQKRIGEVCLGQLTYGSDVIDKLNVVLNEGILVDGTTSGQQLLVIYNKSSIALQATLRDLSLLDGTELMITLDDVDRVRIQDKLMEDKDDAIKDTFVTGWVLVLIAVILVLTFNYINKVGVEDGIDNSVTIHSIGIVFKMIGNTIDGLPSTP